MNPNEWLTALFAALKRMGATAGLIGTAILLALAGARAAKRKSSAARKEALVVDLQTSGIEQNLQQAKELAESANLDKQQGFAAKAAMKKHLTTLAEKNADLDFIAAAHNKLRKSDD